MSVPISGYELVSIIFSMSSNNLDPLINVSNNSETNFLELKSDFKPFEDRIETGHNIDDYYWNVTKGLLALANSSGGILVIGIKEPKDSSGTCEPLDLIFGKSLDKYQHQCLDCVVRHVIDETSIIDNRKVQRSSSMAKWNTALEDHGVGFWSVDHDKLSKYCFTYPCQFKGKTVLAIFVRPVSNDSPLVAKFEPKNTSTSEQHIFVRGEGHFGKTTPLSDIDKIMQFTGTRDPNKSEHFIYLMTFLQSFFPDDSDEVRRRKALGFIQDSRDGRFDLQEKRKLFFDPQPNINISDSLDIDPVNLILSGADYPLAFKSMPFELGSSFGLDRGAYFLLTDAPFDDVHADLVRSEAILRKELEAIGQTKMLSERWWLRLDITKFPVGPNNQDEIFESRLVLDDELVKALKRLKQWRRADDKRFLIPGVLLEIHAGQVQSLGEWCRQLLTHLGDFPREHLAVVVRIQTSEEVPARLDNLLHELRSIIACHEDIPFFAGRWVGHSGLNAELVAEEAYTPFNTLLATPGSGLFTLFYDFGKKYKQSAEEEFRRPSLQKILEEVKKCVDPLKCKCSINVDDVIQDLESLDDWATIFKSETNLRWELYQDLLEIVCIFGTSDHKHQIITRLARSNDDDLRLAALRFASRRDIFLDWWVEGAGEVEERYPQIEQLIGLKNPPEQRPLLQLLVLAMLRAGKSAPGLLGIVKKLYQRFLLADFQKLLEVPRHSIAVSQCTDALVPIAMMSAKSLDMSGFENIGSQVFSSPYLWWTLQSIQVQREWLRKVLTRSAEQKAILGLVTRTEFSSLAEDTLDSVRECRRGLPFSCFLLNLTRQREDSSC